MKTHASHDSRRPRPKIKMTGETYRQCDDDYTGICLACKAPRESTEPDARAYTCDEEFGGGCQAKAVYGVSELLLMGLIEIIGDGDDTEGEWTL